MFRNGSLIGTREEATRKNNSKNEKAKLTRQYQEKKVKGVAMR
jgi:hypothetical protein